MEQYTLPPNEAHYEYRKSNPILKRRGLNINLSAAPIQSLSKNTAKARSKPTLSTRDMARTLHSKPYEYATEHMPNAKVSTPLSHSLARRAKHRHTHHQLSTHSKPSKHILMNMNMNVTSTYSARYKKRISAPIILPCSTTQLQHESTIQQHGGGVTVTTLEPLNTPNTPYYSNIGTPQYVEHPVTAAAAAAAAHKASSSKKKSKKHKHIKYKVSNNKRRKSRSREQYEERSHSPAHAHAHYQVQGVKEKEATQCSSNDSNNTLTTNSNSNSNSSTSSQETITQKHDKNITYSTKSITHSSEHEDDASSTADRESDEYLDEIEINEMIRSYRRISKSRPRAYSKTRRVSQKLFGLMESISLDNDIEKKKKKQGIGYHEHPEGKVEYHQHQHSEQHHEHEYQHAPHVEQYMDEEEHEEEAHDEEEEEEEEEEEDSVEEHDHNKIRMNNLIFQKDEEDDSKVESEQDLLDGKAKHDYHDTLRKYGYVEIRTIAKSLQGIVIEAECMNKSVNKENVIIKITDKQLHLNKISNKHGKALSVQEDIIKEKKLLMYLTANNPPAALVKFLGFFEDTYNYFLVMEHGGTDFFDWIVKCHKWIREGKISLKQWNLYIHDLMLQIVKFLKWLHCKMNVCHLDISLENMLIKNNKYKSDGNGGIRLSRKMQIKFCDFGLAEYFNQDNQLFTCSKYVGKTHYKAPKVYGKKETFDARKADIWSLGVSFFMMVIGAPPYKLPLSNDDHFPMIQRNDCMAILKRWGRDHYINRITESLLNQMLQIDEAKRISIHNIENHPYFTQHLTQQQRHQRRSGLIPKRRSTQDIITLSASSSLKALSNSKRKKKKPSNPVHSNIMATYHDNSALMESPSTMHLNNKLRGHPESEQHHQDRKSVV